MAMQLTSSKTLGSNLSPPSHETRERKRQYRRSPARCQRTTVSGLTMMSASVHRSQREHNATQKSRSQRLRPGRGIALEHRELLAQDENLQAEVVAGAEKGKQVRRKCGGKLDHEPGG